MTTKLTKLALEQINARLAAENEALRKQVLDMQLEVEMHRAPTRRIAAHAPAWQLERAESMRQARAIAMHTGHVVKV